MKSTMDSDTQQNPNDQPALEVVPVEEALWRLRLTATPGELVRLLEIPAGAGVALIRVRAGSSSGLMAPEILGPVRARR